LNLDGTLTLLLVLPFLFNNFNLVILNIHFRGVENTFLVVGFHHLGNIIVLFTVGSFLGESGNNFHLFGV